MNRRNGTHILVAVLLLLALLAPGAAQADYFSAGDYIIPMDNTLQPYAYSSSTPANNDFGIFQAYGLVYKLLDNGVTVYWIINQSPSRTGAYNANYPDITLTGSTTPVTAHSNSDPRGFPTATTLNYYGGPFVINVQNPATKAKVDAVIATWVADPANARVNGAPSNVKHVSIHVAKASFSAPVGRVLRGTPPKIALLDPGGTVDILRGYLYIAGLGSTTNTIYDQVSPNQVANGVLDKINNEYPYTVLWAPHWTGTDYYTKDTWNSTSLNYPGTKSLAPKSLGNIVAVSSDNLTITTDASTNFGWLIAVDNVIFYNASLVEAFQKSIAGWDATNKTINVSPALTAADKLKIGGNTKGTLPVSSINDVHTLTLTGSDPGLVAGLAVTIYDGTGNVKLTTTATGVVVSGGKNPGTVVTLLGSLPDTKSAKTLGWTGAFAWTGSVGLAAGTLVDDDLVVLKVAQFLEGGNVLFAECASIEVFEGSPFGRFLSTRFAGVHSDPGGHANLAFNGLAPKSTMVATQLNPSSPFAQVGDFSYFNTGGHLHNWKAINSAGKIDNAATYPGSSYYSDTSRFVHLADSTQTAYDKGSGPATWYNSGWDVAVAGHYRGDVSKGYVFYLGGHTYVNNKFTGNANGTFTGLYPNADADSSTDQRGGVAGIRYVLNTLLNLNYEVQPREFVRSSPVATADSQLFLGSFEYPGYKGHFRSYNALATDVSAGTYTFYDTATRFPIDSATNAPAADSRRLYYKAPASNTFKVFDNTNLVADYSGAFTGMNADDKAALVNRYRGKEAQINQATGSYKKVDGSLVYDESWKLGPIHYSTPAIVGYSSNVEGGTTRPRVAYVVDGWGVLHAFFAPVIPNPPATTPVITAAWDNTTFANNSYNLSTIPGHLLNVSGAGAVTLTNVKPGEEIYGWVTDNHELNYLKDFGSWYSKGISSSPKTADLLMDVGGNVKRYRTILAIPQGEGTTDVPVLDVTDPLTPTLKYILDNTTAGTGYSHIGHSRSFAIGKVWVNDGTTTAIRNYLFYATESMEGSPGITMAAVDLDNNSVAWRVTMPYDNSSTPNNIPGGPSIVDADGDGIIDYAFAADYEGRVWEMYAATRSSTWLGGTSNFGGRNSTAIPLAKVGVGSSEPIGIVPTVYREGDRLNVVFGTGGTDWAPSVNPSTGAPVYYHVYSYDANAPLSHPSISTGGATQQWVYDLPAGEKVYGNIVKAGPYLFLGTAYGTALNKTDPTADIPTSMAQSGHLIILQSTGATTDAGGSTITREVANIQVGKMVAAVDIRGGKVFYTALTTGEAPTNIMLQNITGIGSANAALIGNQGGPGNRIEVLYWKEVQ